MSKKGQVAVGLDVGSAWTRVAVLRLENSHLRYLGHSATPSAGWHRGQISDQSAVAATIRQAMVEAEACSGCQIGSAVVGVGGPAVRSQQGRGLYEFGHRRLIEKGDMVYSVELAARARLDEDRFLLQVLPQDFTVDGQTPIPHPLNIECQRLEAHALLITTSKQEHQALVSAVHMAHIRVEETVFEAMAAAYASVRLEERMGGVAVVDIGAHGTNLVYYDGDAMLFAAGLPLSGDHFTRDICELKALSFEEAERLKFAYGCALLGLTADNIIIELPAETGRPGREINRRELIEILEARASQLFEYVGKLRARYASDLVLREGLVLVGGGCQLEGLVELAEKILGCPARLGFPQGIMDAPAELMTPVWSIPIGLAMYSAKLQARKEKGGGPSFWSLFTGRP